MNTFFAIHLALFLFLLLIGNQQLASGCQTKSDDDDLSLGGQKIPGRVLKELGFNSPKEASNVLAARAMPGVGDSSPPENPPSDDPSKPKTPLERLRARVLGNLQKMLDKMGKR